MANAVRSISISQGADPRQHALVSFGGAAGQHICEIASLLGIETIVDPPEAGLLSALGMGMARLQYTASCPIYKKLSDLHQNWLSEARDALAESIRMQNPPPQEEWESLSCRIEARYVGAEGTLSLEWPLTLWNPTDFANQFHAMHAKRFGYDRKDRPLEIATVHGIVRSQERNRLAALSIPTQAHLVETDSKILYRSEMTPGDTYVGLS